MNFHPGKPRKYRNTPTIVDGIKFASKKEATRYAHLKLLERGGAIKNLRLQPRYPLSVNGLHVCTYVGDFDFEENGRLITEDVKGVKTAEFVIKAKLFHAIYGREIQLV